MLYRLANLCKRNRRLGLKVDLLRNAGLLSSLPVAGPTLRQVQTPRDGKAGVVGADRQTHRHPAVLLFAHLPTVLPRYPHRVRSLLHEAGIIYNPGHHWSVLFHRGKDVLPHALQNRFITPGRISDQMMQGLVRAPDIVG